MRTLLLIPLFLLISCYKQPLTLIVGSSAEEVAMNPATGKIRHLCFTGGMITGRAVTHGITAANAVFIYSILGVDTISSKELIPTNGRQDFTLSQGEGGYCDNLPTLKLVVYNGNHKKVLDKKKSTCESCN